MASMDVLIIVCCYIKLIPVATHLMLEERPRRAPAAAILVVFRLFTRREGCSVDHVLRLF